MEQTTQLVDLYRLFREEKHKSIEFHLQTFKHFITLFLAVLGATVAGVAHFYGQHQAAGCVIIAGSFMGGLSSVLGFKTCDQFYRGALNAVTVLSKLECSLGLYTRPDAPNADPAEISFASDPSLLPRHWLTAGSRYSTAKEFVDKTVKRGFNRYVRCTFYAMAAVSSIGLLLGVLCLLY